MDKGTITNASGEFSIMVPPNATLIVSFVGMETKEVDIKGRRNIVIVLEESSVLLDEVVAIGYGKQSRALITNSISKINTIDNINKSLVCFIEFFIKNKIRMNKLYKD